MAQKPEDGRDAFGIARVGKRKWGYDVAQVDAFLEQAHSLYEGEGMQLTSKDIQGVSFDMRRGGYQYKQVDAALDRLERAVVDKQTAWEIAHNGRVASKAKSERLLRQISDHAGRAAGQRFAPGQGKTPSYDRKQVDGLVDRIVRYAAAQLHGDDAQDMASDDVETIDSNTVSHAIFTQRKGSKGYDERQVDYFLATCAHLLTRLESFARVANYEGQAVAAPEPATSPSATALTGDTREREIAMDTQSPRQPEHTASGANAGQETEIIGVSPLFSGNPERRIPPSYAPQIEDSDHGVSFDALHKAEQAIFASDTVADDPTVGAPGIAYDDQDSSEHDAGNRESYAPAVHIPDTSREYVQKDVAAPTASPVTLPPDTSEAPARITPVVEQIHGAEPRSTSPLAPATSGGVDADDGARTHDVKDGEPTLSALAHLAEITHDAPIPSATSENPHVPSLPDFSMPHFDTGSDPSRAADSHMTWDDAGHPATGEVAHTTSDESTAVETERYADERTDKGHEEVGKASPLFPSSFGGPQDDVDLNIPDLSFPSFATDGHDQDSKLTSDDGAKHSEDGRDITNR